MYYNLFPPYAMRPTLSRLGVFLSLIFTLQTAYSQLPDSICSVIRISQAYAAPGDTVALDVRATIPTGLISLQFKLKWDNSNLIFDRTDIAETELNGLTASDIYSGNTGEVRISWYDLSGQGILLDDDALLFKLYLRVKPDAADYTPVRFDLATSGFVFEAYSGIDFKLPYNIVHGGVSTTNDTLSYPRILSVCSYRAGCEGANPSGAINLSVDGGTPPYSYTWSGPNNFSSYNQDISSVKAGKYNVTVTDLYGLSVEGIVEVPEGENTLSIDDAVLVEDPCNLSEGSVSVFVSGGQPPYSYNWSPGIFQDTSAILGLGSGTYKVSVTDAEGCIQEEVFTLNFTQPLNISTTTIAPTCGPNATTGKIVLSPFGGASPYSFQWNTPGITGDVYENCPAGLHVVTVTDGNGCKFVRNIVLNHQNTNQWVISQQNLCTPGENTGKIALSASSNLIKWPVSVRWSNGVVQTAHANNNGISGADTLGGLSDGFYNATLIDSIGCTHTVLNLESNCGFLNTFDDQNCFNLQIEGVSANPGDYLCLPVAAKTFVGIRRMKIRLYWNPDVLEYKGLASQDLSVNDIQEFVNADNVDIDWFSSLPVGQGLTLIDGSYLFNVCFQVKSNAPAGLAQVRFDKPTVALSNFVNLKNGRQLGVMGFDGQIAVSNAPFNVLSINGCTNLPLCDEDGLATLNIQIANGTPPYSAVWTNNLDLPQSGSVEDIKYLKNGFYRVNITDAAGKTGSFGFLYQNPNGPFNCIWPGDADNNNSVNHFDVLYVGLGYGSFGPDRPDASTDWVGVQTTPWPQSTPFRQVNYSNMDCDGDAQVDNEDLTAIETNWNQVVRPGVDDPMGRPFIPPSIGIDSFALYVGTDTLVDEDFSLPVIAGGIGDTASSVLGLAFSIEYDPALIDPATVAFTPANSWLGNPSNNLLVFSKNSIPGRLDVALARKSGSNPATGLGTLGSFSGKLIDQDWQANDPVQSTDIAISNWLGLTLNERALPIKGLQSDVYLDPSQLVGTQDIHSLKHFTIQCYPNPARETATLFVAETGMETVEVCNAAGALVRVQHLGGAHQAKVDLSGLTPGLYWLKVLTGRGAGWIKLSIM